ncbi:MAG: hypothetical protein M3Q08_13615 [Pseudomonadota bacterium]|nr:hypothetical protein [Pseudomonadota bacterium]
MRPRLALLLTLTLLAPSCATRVYHSTKSEPEMQADIRLCSDQANRKFWMDAIAALYHAYDCLEAKGYQRAQAVVGNKVQRAVAAGRKRLGAGEVCRVPC